MAGAKATPGLEIGSIFRTHAEAFRNHHPGLPGAERRVLRAIALCRTRDLGGHLYRCKNCQAPVPMYNSCLNRHCPTCQGPARYRWIEQRLGRLLPVIYFHLVFTLPAQLRPLARRHPTIIFDLLFSSTFATLRDLARDPKHLGAQIGLTLVLHTWRRDMLFHPHVHGIMPGGGLSSDGSRWVHADPEYLFPWKVMAEVFRGKFLEALIDLHDQGAFQHDAELDQKSFRRLTGKLARQKWVVYSKPSFGGPEQIVRYLGQYTHRIAIANSRLLEITDTAVTFSTKDAKTCTLTPENFIERFLLHVVPDRYTRIRHYGLMAAGNVKTKLARAQQLLLAESPEPSTDLAYETASDPGDASAEKTAADDDKSKPRCPHCQSTDLKLIATIPRPPPRRLGPPPHT